MSDTTFYTGYFTVDGQAQQKMHMDEEFDDPVIDRTCGFDYDGYVSNIGREIEIHIKKEKNNEDNINFIKHMFIHYPEAVQGISVVAIDGE